MLAAMCSIILTCTCFAQDVIVTKDSKKIDAKVMEVNVNDVRYKKFDNPDGPSYALPKSDIVTIVYQNGRVETFQQTSPETAQTTLVATEKAPVSDGKSTMLISTPSELIYKNQGLQSGIYQNGIRLNAKQVRGVMSGNREALKMYNSGQTLGMVGIIFSGIGGGLIGWDLGMRLGGDDGNGTVLAVGAVGIVVGLGFALIGDANVKKSVPLYNSKLNSNFVSYQINFGFTQTGVGLSMRF